VLKRGFAPLFYPSPSPLKERGIKGVRMPAKSLIPKAEGRVLTLHQYRVPNQGIQITATNQEIPARYGIISNKKAWCSPIILTSLRRDVQGGKEDTAGNSALFLNAST